MSLGLPKKGRLNQIYVQEDRVNLRKLICLWCRDILMEPQRLYCGHSVCLGCVQNEVQRAKMRQQRVKCIVCGQVIEQSQIGEDRIGKAIVENLRVRCSSKNCKWEGRNSDFSQHYQLECQHNQRAGDSRYQYRYFSTGAEFVSKLNDEEQIRQQRPNMLHPASMSSLREKLEKEWEVQQNFKDEEWRRKTKRFRHTFRS